MEWLMPYWAVARAEPNRDRLAVAGVVLAGFETFAPKMRVRVGLRWNTVAVLPSYFFVRIVDRWHIIERTAGVCRLVRFGDTPARCPDTEIAKLLARADPDGVVRLAAANEHRGRLCARRAGASSRGR